ncbi:MAG: hypothetical protein M1834_007080 [Cirrosporium novae-zelandiae]|nr:MAG: hypothetical protein M1834_007080 [Cirrosporium novae-zelandiae]
MALFVVLCFLEFWNSLGEAYPEAAIELLVAYAEKFLSLDHPIGFYGSQALFLVVLVLALYYWGLSYECSDDAGESTGEGGIIGEEKVVEESAVGEEVAVEGGSSEGASETKGKSSDEPESMASEEEFIQEELLQVELAVQVDPLWQFVQNSTRGEDSNEFARSVQFDYAWIDAELAELAAGVGSNAPKRSRKRLALSRRVRRRQGQEERKTEPEAQGEDLVEVGSQAKLREEGKKTELEAQGEDLIEVGSQAKQRDEAGETELEAQDEDLKEVLFQAKRREESLGEKMKEREEELKERGEELLAKGEELTKKEDLILSLQGELRSQEASFKEQTDRTATEEASLRDELSAELRAKGEELLERDQLVQELRDQLMSLKETTDRQAEHQASQAWEVERLKADHDIFRRTVQEKDGKLRDQSQELEASKAALEGEKSQCAEALATNIGLEMEMGVLREEVERLKNGVLVPDATDYESQMSKMLVDHQRQLEEFKSAADRQLQHEVSLRDDLVRAKEQQITKEANQWWTARTQDVNRMLHQAREEVSNLKTLLDQEKRKPAAPQPATPPKAVPMAQSCTNCVRQKQAKDTAINAALECQKRLTMATQAKLDVEKEKEAMAISSRNLEGEIQFLNRKAQENYEARLSDEVRFHQGTAKFLELWNKTKQETVVGPVRMRKRKTGRVEPTLTEQGTNVPPEERDLEQEEHEDQVTGDAPETSSKKMCDKTETLSMPAVAQLFQFQDQLKYRPPMTNDYLHNSPRTILDWNNHLNKHLDRLKQDRAHATLRPGYYSVDLQQAERLSMILASILQAWEREAIGRPMFTRNPQNKARVIAEARAWLNVLEPLFREYVNDSYQTVERKKTIDEMRNAMTCARLLIEKQLE